MLDLVVEGNAYLEGIINKCCIGIEDGKIVALKKILKGEKQFDFGDKLILPTGIDVHVHFRDPGFTDKEDFETGTESAAFGGISCVFDMPNTKPPVVSSENFEEKLGIVRRKACIDFGLYSSIMPGTRIKKLAKICSAFKIYLGSTTGNLLFGPGRSLSTALYKINSFGRVPAIHAESESIIQRNINKLPNPKNLHDHLRTRPNYAEKHAIARVLNIVKRWAKIEKEMGITVKNKTNESISKEINDFQYSQNLQKKIHICHVSTSDSVELIRSFRRFINKQVLKDSILISTEVTPHHLLLNESYKGGTFGKVNPPLRAVDDQQAVWSAFLDGTLNILASDHAPHTYDNKDQEFSYAPSGLPGVETMVPLMLSKVKHKQLSLDTLVSAVALRPGKLFNLRKGRLSPGFDGDLMVVDFHKERPIKNRDLHSKCGWTPYEKMDAIFPIFTTVRGNITIKNNNLEADPGWGKFHN
jgi:dihydroorotase